MAIATVIPTSNKLPGSFIRVSLGVGQRSAGDAPRKVLLYGNKLSGGAAAVEEPIQVLTEDDARDLFGAGSELHLMVRAALAVSRTVDLNAVAIAESAGANATGTLSFGSGPATEAGTVTVWINGSRVVASFDSGSTSTNVAAAVVDAINGDPDLPVTATNTTGDVTVTAKQAGPRGNFIRLRSLKEGGAGVSHTAVSAYLTGGTTSDDPQDAIDAAAGDRYHYHVAPYEDSTELLKFRTHVRSDAEPEIGQRELYVFASRDTLGNVTTLATAQNASRGQCVWHYNAETTPAEMAAAMAAFRAVSEGADPAANLDWGRLPGIRPAVSTADLPEDAELVSALNNGITPLRVVDGEASIVRSITSRSQDASGNPDFGVLDTSKVVVPDFIADDLDANWIARFSGTKATPIEDPPPPPGTISPNIVRDFIYERLKLHEANGLIVDVDAKADQIAVELADTPDGRFNASIPVDVIEGAHQFAGDVRQIG